MKLAFGRWGLAVVVVGLTVSACGSGTSPTGQTDMAVVSPKPVGGRLDPETTWRLDRAVGGVMRQANAPGVIVGLWTENGGYVRAFGVADKATKTPMSTGLYTRIGSETKTFTVTALLRLVDQGKLKLDDPVSKYVSGVPDGNRITLRQLAGMRSGLYPYSSDTAFQKALFADPERSFTPRQLLAYAFKHKPVFAPGKRFQYSNTDTILLGLVVEKASGKPLREFVRREVLVPAGLRRTFFPKGAEFPKPHAHGYTKQTAKGKVADATGWNTSWAWAAGAMISTLEDLRTWAKVLATGTLLTPATEAERLKNPSWEPSFPGLRYGLGVFENRGWIGHNGSLPGYQSVVVHLPSKKATLVVLTNTDDSYRGRDVGTLFARAITGIVTPENVYTLPASTTASASPTRS